MKYRGFRRGSKAQGAQLSSKIEVGAKKTYRVSGAYVPREGAIVVFK